MNADHSRNKRSSGFTLVELLVVIGIIGLIIAILLPSLGAVRTAAKRTETLATINTVESALEAYRQATDGPYPPSNSDAIVAATGEPTNLCDSPYANTVGTTISVTGANLLMWALVGADLLGSPSFKDVNRDAARLWSDDTHNVTEAAGAPVDGLYALDTSTRDELHSRLGKFIEDDKPNVAIMGDYALDNLYPRNNLLESVPMPTNHTFDLYLKMPLLLDGFKQPILYYRANVGARAMTSFMDGSAWETGVYDQLDNAPYTDDGTAGIYSGMDMGAGKDHDMLPWAAGISSDPSVANLNDTTFDGTFAKFIWNRQVTVRIEPVRKDSYLLISAGPDGLYGTEDDVTNFGN